MSTRIVYQDQLTAEQDAEREAVVKSRYENADPALYMQGIFEKSAEAYYSGQGYSGADLNAKIEEVSTNPSFDDLSKVMADTAYTFRYGDDMSKRCRQLANFYKYNADTESAVNQFVSDKTELLKALGEKELGIPLSEEYKQANAEKLEYFKNHDSRINSFEDLRRCEIEDAISETNGVGCLIRNFTNNDYVQSFTGESSVVLYPENTSRLIADWQPSKFEVKQYEPSVSGASMTVGLDTATQVVQSPEYVPNGTAADAAHYEGEMRSKYGEMDVNAYISGIYDRVEQAYYKEKAMDSLREEHVNDDFDYYMFENDISMRAAELQANANLEDKKNILQRFSFNLGSRDNQETLKNLYQYNPESQNTVSEFCNNKLKEFEVMSVEAYDKPLSDDFVEQCISRESTWTYRLPGEVREEAVKNIREKYENMSPEELKAIRDKQIDDNLKFVQSNLTGAVSSDHVNKIYANNLETNLPSNSFKTESKPEYVPNGTAADAAYYEGQKKSASGVGSVMQDKISQSTAEVRASIENTMGAVSGAILGLPNAGLIQTASSGAQAGTNIPNRQTGKPEYVPNGTAADAAYYEGQKRNIEAAKSAEMDRHPRMREAKPEYVPNGTAADAAYYEGQARSEAEARANVANAFSKLKANVGAINGASVEDTATKVDREQQIKSEGLWREDGVSSGLSQAQVDD